MNLTLQLVGTVHSEPEWNIGNENCLKCSISLPIFHSGSLCAVSSVPSKEDACFKVILFAVSVRKNRSIQNMYCFLVQISINFYAVTRQKLTLELGSSVAGVNI